MKTLVFLINGLIEGFVGIILLFGACFKTFPSFMLPLTKVNQRANVLLELAAIETCFVLSLPSLVAWYYGPTRENSGFLACGLLCYHFWVALSSAKKLYFNQISFGADPIYSPQIPASLCNKLNGISAFVQHLLLFWGFLMFLVE
jgi:hypothetical protein